MFTFGSQVNPSLLRQDFSPILQAAQAQAQATQQAAAIRAQSLAQLGQTVAQGFQTYAQNQEKKKQEAAATNTVANIFKASPFLAKSLNIPQDQNGEFDKGALKDFIKVYGPGQAVQVASALDQMTRARQQQEKELADRARLDQFLTQTPAGAAISGGTSFENLPTGAAAFLPRQFGNAQELLVAGQRAGIPVSQLLPVATGMASLGKTEAEAAALRIPKPEKAPTGAEGDIAAKVKSFTSKFGRAPNDTEYEQIRDAVNASRKPTNITNVGPGLSTAIYNDLAKEKSDLFALREAVANYDTALNEITGSKAFSGPAGAIKYAGARALQMFGSDAFKSEADAYQAAGSALASSVLSIARQLPGASSDRDVIFLERVARGDERVPSAEVLMKIKARVEAKVARLDSALQSKIQAFGEASKGDPNSEFAFKILSAKPRTQVPSLPANF